MREMTIVADAIGPEALPLLAQLRDGLNSELTALVALRDRAKRSTSAGADTAADVFGDAANTVAQRVASVDATVVLLKAKRSTARGRK